MVISKRSEIQQAIFRKGLTHQEFAEKIGISPNMLSLIINGKKKPGPRTAKSIVENLDTDFDNLFEFTESEVSN